MKIFGRYVAFLIAVIALSSSAKADQHLEFIWGHQTTRCTYLSPLTYTGPGYGLSYEWRHPAWRNRSVGMQAHADFNYGYLLSPAKNSRMYDLTFDLEWGVERLWDGGKGFHWSAGATVGIDGGVLYLPRNGNNPAQALMWGGATLTARGEYDRLKLFGKPLRISERIEVPTIGCFFCPAYGETYYEIYVGNHSGLAHFGWWGNRPQIKSRLRADWQLGKYALTLGFDYRFQGLECNDITTRLAQCSGVIGISF
ncbi:MAG: DUF3316 domain-containing protein [Muribaculaceae bacterium]|nr:DUF3316 domain-containing protein [Muribaculaceae bacterium]